MTILPNLRRAPGKPHCAAVPNVSAVIARRQRPARRIGRATLSAMHAPRHLAAAYVASRYPKLTETFVFREIAELERQGHSVLCFAFALGDGADLHPDAGAAARLVILPETRRIAAAQLYWLRRRPAEYLRLWGRCAAESAKSPLMLLRTFAAIPVGAVIGRVVVERDIDHIHAHWATHPTTAALVASALADVPFSFTAHAHDIQVDTAMLPWKLRRAAFAVTVSAFNRCILEKLEPEARVEVIRCGVDADAFRPRPRSPAHNPFRISCVGRLAPEKGQEHLLHALAVLKRHGRIVRCAFVGAGADQHRLERLSTSLGLTGVVFHGGLGSDGVRQVLADSDAMVLPSVRLPSGRTEGLPVALMEAMSMAVPVIASRVAGVPELVRDGETGLLVDPGSERQLAEAVTRLMDDERFAHQIGLAGRRLVNREHDLEQSASRLVILFAGGHSR
jgi:colanic acid/amylovoran biosynthesis glycosyltransferase